MKNKILAALACIVLTGCIAAPANKITIKTPKGTYEVSNPKNTCLEGLKAIVNPDGTIDIVVNRMQSTNDPAVIDKTAAGQALLTREYFDGMNKILMQMQEMGKKSMFPSQ